MSKVLVTERLTLWQLEFEDAEALERLAGEKDVADTTLSMPHPYPIGSVITFIKARHEAEARGDGYSLVITLSEDFVFLGVIGLHVNKRHNMAELAIGLENPIEKRLLYRSSREGSSVCI